MRSCDHKFVDSNVCLKCGISVHALKRDVRPTKRIQRKRTKGWRMPPNTIYVGRGSKWGNSCTVKRHGRVWYVRYGMFQHDVVECGNESEARQLAVDLYRQDIPGGVPFTLDELVTELRCKDLACWCPLDKPCHADTLLELARLKLHHDDQCPNEGACGWAPGQTFVCTRCGHEYCYCQGCGDDHPELCDYCWCEVTNGQST